MVSLHALLVLLLRAVLGEQSQPALLLLLLLLLSVRWVNHQGLKMLGLACDVCPTSPPPAPLAGLHHLLVQLLLLLLVVGWV
jgi:hypothetical protein